MEGRPTALQLQKIRDQAVPFRRRPERKGKHANVFRKIVLSVLPQRRRRRRRRVMRRFCFLVAAGFPLLLTTKGNFAHARLILWARRGCIGQMGCNCDHWTQLDCMCWVEMVS